MAYNKHQKLAKGMQEVLDGIDDHAEKVAEQLNIVQLHFYEKSLIIGRPLASRRVLKAIMQSHYLGLQQLCPFPDLKMTCQMTPWLGLIINKPVFRRSEILHKQTNGWFIPWGVKIVVPNENKLKLKRKSDEALLYCADSTELSQELDWFEAEDAADSLTHQMLTIVEHDRRLAIIRDNMLKDPAPIWEEAKREWLENPSEESDWNAINEVPRQPQSLDEVDFAPKKEQSLALAYEEVMRSIRQRQYRHRADLRNIYKKKLELSIFEGVPWGEAEEATFLQEWRDNFFGEKSLRKLQPGRWTQCEGVDRYTAAKFIRHFATQFIDDPTKKKMGEVACILWILVWAAQEGKSDKITLREVLDITSQDIEPSDSIVKIGGVDLDISWRLHRLLMFLCGKGKGDRARRLFAELDRGGKSLERALVDASIELLGKDAIPVLPAAFLISPHLYQGVRMSAAERKAQKNVCNLIPFRHTHKTVKAALREAREAIS